jgi:hypothetical protein
LATHPAGAYSASLAAALTAGHTLAVNTLGGADTVSVAPDVSTQINPVVDLGAYQ